MDWLKKGFGAVGKVISGGFSEAAGKVIDVVVGQFPEKMGEAEKKQLELEVKKVMFQQEQVTLQRWNEQEQVFFQHVQAMEGTAKDLKSIPILGNVFIFLRGCLRPATTIITLIVDLKVLSGSWSLLEIAERNAQLATQYTSLIWMLNLVVFISLFGERAVQNLMPLFERLLLGRASKGDEFGAVG